MLIFPCPGAVLNRAHGRETARGLAVSVTARTPADAPATVNGSPAAREGGLIRAEVVLQPGFNTLQVACGGAAQATTVVWDQGSFKRYHFFIDDNIFFLTELYRSGARSLFDHFYTARLRRLHDRYGVRFVLNLFFRNDHSAFLLSQFPDRYRGEWADHADWLRLAFHAYSEFPAWPYRDAHPEALPAHFEAVREQVLRFAGPSVFYPPAIVHFYSIASPDARRFLREAGCRAMAVRAFPEAASQARIPALYEEDPGWFTMPVDFFCNSRTLPQIESDLDRLLACPWKETLMIGTHEQYSYPSYKGYLPDHFDRMEAAIRRVTEAGFRPVFFQEGILGA